MQKSEVVGADLYHTTIGKVASSSEPCLGGEGYTKSLICRELELQNSEKISKVVACGGLWDAFWDDAYTPEIWHRYQKWWFGNVWKTYPFKYDFFLVAMLNVGGVYLGNSNWIVPNDEQVRRLKHFHTKIRSKWATGWGLRTRQSIVLKTQDWKYHNSHQLTQEPAVPTRSRSLMLLAAISYTLSQSMTIYPFIFTVHGTIGFPMIPVIGSICLFFVFTTLLLRSKVWQVCPSGAGQQSRLSLGDPGLIFGTMNLPKDDFKPQFVWKLRWKAIL